MCLKLASKIAALTNCFFLSLMSRQVTFDKVTVANISNKALSKQFMSA